MGSGIAVEFRQRFGRVGELRASKAKAGGMVTLQDGGRYLYYLVTKNQSSSKPKWAHFKASLSALKGHCMEHQVTSLAMPRIGCGLDRLPWPRVKKAIEKEFTGMGIDLRIYDGKTLPDVGDEEDESYESLHSHLVYPLHPQYDTDPQVAREQTGNHPPMGTHQQLASVMDPQGVSTAPT